MTGPVPSTIRIQTFQTSADRDVAIPSPGPGELCYIIGSGAVRLTGPVAGGTGIVLRGNVGNVIAVDFGGVPASEVEVNDDELTVVSPAHPAGEVTLTVTTADGETKECGGRFAYV